MITDEHLKEVLWRVCLSDHIGDVCGAIKPILDHFGLGHDGLEEILDGMKSKGLEPEWAKENEDE